MAQKPPIGKAAAGVTAQHHRVLVDVDVSRVYEPLRNETLRLIPDLMQRGLRGDELAERVTAGLREVSDETVERAARDAIGESFNLGRNLGIQERLSDIREVVRTEILDGNTCEPCRLVDGAVVKVNTPEYLELMPPNLCDGREQCRGFYMPRAV